MAGIELLQVEWRKTLEGSELDEVEQQRNHDLRGHQENMCRIGSPTSEEERQFEQKLKRSFEEKAKLDARLREKGVEQLNIATRPPLTGFRTKRNASTADLSSLPPCQANDERAIKGSRLAMIAS